MNFLPSDQLNKVSYPKNTITLLHVTLFFAACKNLFHWGYLNVFDQTKFRAPIIEPLIHIPQSIGICLIVGSLISCLLLFSNKFKFIPYFFVSISQTIVLFTDYYAFHHDVAFSSIVFFIVGLALLLKDPTIGLVPLILISSSVYFLTGLAKITPNFIGGDVIDSILKAGVMPPVWIFPNNIYPTSYFLKPFAVELSYITIFVEIFLFPISLFFIPRPFIFLRLVALPFHFYLLCAGTGTVFNLVFPSLILMQFESFYSLEINLAIKNLSSKLANYVSKIFIIIAILSILRFIAKFIFPDVTVIPE